MFFFHLPSDEAVRTLSSDALRGLTEQQALEKRAQYGENRLREKKRKPLEEIAVFKG